MKNKTNIAMRCNQEQWELLKPKVSHFDIKSAKGFNESSYITNNFCGEFGILASLSYGGGYGREVHEEFNEKIFLEACGIFKEPKFEITKETVIKYQMKDEFPEVFGLPKDFTGWVKSINEIDADWLMYFENGVQKYGIDSCKDWWESTIKIKEVLEGDEVESTTEEVTEALKNEALRRYKVGQVISSFISGIQEIPCFEDFKLEDGIFEVNGAWLMKDGVWATIERDVKTIKEAEELLNCKIV